MTNNLLELIKDWVNKRDLTTEEKRRMRTALVHYATTHPVKSGLMSPYRFRYVTMAFASLLLVLGGSVGITNAAARALPNQPLYGVKIWIEQFQASTQKTPDAVIAFETKRIETRFNEATQLALNHQLNDTTSNIIQSGLEYSRTAIKNVADSVQSQNPELALAATNNLETTFSSNSKILGAIETNTNQNIGTLVLAAQKTTETIAAQKIPLEHLVAMKPNDTTKAITVTELAKVETLLAQNDANVSAVAAPAIDTSSQGTAVTPAPLVPTTLAALAPTASLKKLSMTLQAAPIATPAIASAVTSISTPTQTPQDLVVDAKVKMAQGQYSEALVSLQKAEQLLDEATLTKTLETTYDVTTKSVSPTEAPTTASAIIQK